MRRETQQVEKGSGIPSSSLWDRGGHRTNTLRAAGMKQG
jgi:hypothetical protein